MLFGWFKKAPEPAPVKKAPVRRVRAYTAAQGGRLLGSWLGTSNSADTEIYTALETLRARGRDLAQNNGYAKRFLSMCKTNIVGHTGVRLQNKAYAPNGVDLDKKANAAIEARWRQFCRMENCCVSGDLSMIDLKKLIIETVMRDGEILIRRYKFFQHNAFEYALQPIEADQLDHTVNCTLANGNKVVMGVEKDKWGRRVAYHILSAHPGESLTSDYHRRERERIPASEILHLFIPERVNQTRGVSWLAPSAARAKMLDAYEEAEVIAARVSASKMGIFTRPEGTEDDDLTDDELEEVEANDSEDLNIEVEPGTFDTAPDGYDLKMFDPTHPNAAFGEFMKGGLRGIASGWDCSYVMLANNLEGVNLSSIRHGEVAERDKWRILQTWLIEHFCTPIFEEWLEQGLTYQWLDGLLLMQRDRLNAPCWRPRGWQFVDIDKESKAVTRDVANHTRNIWDVAAQRGDDLEEIFEGNARAIELAKEYGLALHILKAKRSRKMELTREQRDKIKTEQFYRAVPVVREGIDKEARTVEIAFSSEDPYLRWYGYEILGHRDGEVDMDFMASGAAPFLLQHRHSDQMGVVESARIDKDGKGRAVVRFSKSAKAEEIFQDIIDGIRKNISVGYEVLEMTLVEQKKDEPDVYRMKWRPFEASSVSVPADTSVGVGRSGEVPTNPKIEVTRMDPKEKEQKEKEQREAIEKARQDAMKEAREAEVVRIGEIDALGKAHGFEKEAAEAIQKGQGEDQFRRFVLDELRKRGLKPTENFTPEIGMSQKEAQRFSFLRAINALANPNRPDAQRAAAFEIECSEAVGKKLKKSSEGLFIPVEVATRDLTVGTATAGGNTVATNLLAGSFIDMLRNRMMVRRMGATVLTDLVGDIAIPRQTGGATCYWVAESGAPTESQQAFDQVTMSPETIGAFTDISRKLLLQSSIDVEQFVRGDLAKSVALGIDLAAINGSGSSNQPTGILNVSGIGAVVGGTNGLAPTWGNVVDLWSAVAGDNADVGSLGYLTNSKVVGKLMQTEKATGTAQFVCKDFPDKEGMTALGGARCGVSNQVPSTLTKGTSASVCSAIIYGNWADLLIGMWGGLSLTVDPFTGATSGTVRVVVLQDIDIAVRHAESFAAMVDALTA